MGRLRHILIAIVSAALLWGVFSCNTAGCLENRSSLPLAGFYSYSTGEQIAIDSIAITGIGSSSGEPINDFPSALSSLYLPMRSTEQSTSWEIAYKRHSILDGTLCDTISFDYSSMPYFASEECGVIYKYRIERMSYTHYLIDSIAITDSLISNTDVERIKIFFRTAEPDAPDDESDTDEVTDRGRSGAGAPPVLCSLKPVK